MEDKDEGFFKYETSKHNFDKEDKKKSLYEQEDMGDVYNKTIKNVEKTFKFSSKVANFLAPIAMSTIIAASSVFLIEKGFEVKRSFKARGWIEANCPNIKRLIFRRPANMLREFFSGIESSASISNIPVVNQYFQALNDPLVCYYIAGFSAEYYIANVDNP